MTNQFQVDLYDFCSVQVKDALKTFCDRVNRSQADTYIIMAHKAVQLFYILLAQGHINKQVAKKVIVSNLSLDFNCHYLKGRKIAILDDIVISGTSIASTVNKLMDCGVRQDDIEVIAIAIDQDYFAMNFENTKGVSVLHCDFNPKDAPCIELSAVISKVFSYYGVSYDVDFPMYEGLPVQAAQLNILHNSLFWDVTDVSNANQRAGCVDVYTLSPTQPVRYRLWTAIGAELEDCADVKIRLYIKRYPDGSRECCVVPMFLFREISVESLGILYDRLKPADQDFVLNHPAPCLAQMRYLEFFIAHQLYLIFSQITSLGCGFAFRENIAKQLFGPRDGEIVYRHLRTPCDGGAPILHVGRAAADHTALIAEYKRSAPYRNSCSESANWDGSDSYQLGCWINQFIFTPFLWWYDDKELPVRRELREEALHYVRDYPKIERHLFRLKNGLPMSALRQLLQDRVPDLSDREAYDVISAFLDRAIDEGIIVPTIYYSEDGQYLCRAYRHGEDLPFGVADQYRLVYFLRAIGTSIRKAEGGENGPFPTIAEISLEKMIVLFYQMGLKQGNIFNRFLGFNNINIIHSFLSVHGTIQGFAGAGQETHIYSERDGKGNRYITWLTTWLYDAGLIKTKQNPDADESSQTILLDKVEQYLANNQRSAVSDTVQENIESLAELITTWYNAMAKTSRRMFRDNITALTSCANRFVYASAIATEIHYFSKFWDNQAMHALQDPHSSQQLVDRLTDSKDNAEYTSRIVRVLHSGREKAFWRHTNYAQEVIKEVKTFQTSTGTRLWAQLWDGVDAWPDHNKDDLKVYTAMAEGLLYFFSAAFECLKSQEFWACGTLPPHYSRRKDAYLLAMEGTDLPESLLFAELEKIAKLPEDELRQKAAAFQRLVSEGLFRSKQCVEHIEDFVRRKDPTYTVTYRSALILDIAALDSRQTDGVFMRFWERLPEEDLKTTLNIIRFPEELDQAPYAKYGIFFGQNKQQALDAQVGDLENEAVKFGEFLYTAFQKLCSMLNGRVYRVRGILLPHIIPTPDTLFEHNLHRNIADNAKKFYDHVIQPLEAYYEDKWQMQLVLGLDRLVGELFLDLFPDWHSTKLDLIAPAAPEGIRKSKWITNCILCVKEHAQLSESQDSLMDKIAYSQLRVSCGKHTGLGLLLRLSDRVVCLSCNHLFEDYSLENPAKAISAYCPDITFNLKPLTEIRQYSGDGILSAEDEALVLEPCWNGNISFEVSRLVSIEDLADASVSKDCTCYGCNEDGQMKWIYSIHVAGPIGKGYYQIGGEIGQIQSGCSGGVYVQSGTQSELRIIGIHDGRFDDCEQARMIPWSSIKAALKKISERNM